MKLLKFIGKKVVSRVLIKEMKNLGFHIIYADDIWFHYVLQNMDIQKNVYDILND